MHYVLIRCEFSIKRHRDLAIFRHFLGYSITLSRCRCREAKRLSRATLCFKNPCRGTTYWAGCSSDDYQALVTIISDLRYKGMYKLIKKCTNFRSLLFSQHLQSYSIYSRDMSCVKVKRTDSTHLCSKVYWHLNLDRSLRFVRIMKLFMNKFLTDPKPCINQCTQYRVQSTVYTVHSTSSPKRDG